MKKDHSFYNNWSLKDILILGGILAGIIHNTSSSTTIAKDATDSVTHGLTRIENKVATLTAKQEFYEEQLDAQEIRLRAVEQNDARQR
jgi:hypothetical protein